MDLWVLNKRPTGMVEPFELTRLREEARALDIRFEAVALEEIDLIVSRGGRRSIRRCGAEVELPDVLLPRTGSGTDYFSLAILRQLEHLGVAVVNPTHHVGAFSSRSPSGRPTDWLSLCHQAAGWLLWRRCCAQP